MPDLETLIEKLEKAEAGSRELDRAVYAACDKYMYAQRVTTSLDAAVALVELVLPGHEYQLWVDLENKKRFAQVSEAVWDECGDSTLEMSRAGFALALCIALLKALHAKELAR